MSNSNESDVEDTPVLYVYKCAMCGHRGEMRLAGDGHDGEQRRCGVCSADVYLEWDGGVVLEGMPGFSQ